MDVREFLGLQETHNPHRWVLPVTDQNSTRGGFLFGGSGLGASVAAMEATSGRPLIWATAQYLSYARPPAYLDIDVVVPVAGKRTTQARAVGHVGDTEILTVNAALGSRPMDVSGEWVDHPDVPSPDECPLAPTGPGHEKSIGARFEIRVASGALAATTDADPSPDGRSILWIRLPEGVEVSAGLLSIVADWMTAGVGRALGRLAGANSLDNTIRIIQPVPTLWVLCDIRIHSVRNGFVHGLIHLWSDDGTLMATGGQSGIVRLFDEPPR